MAVRERPGAEAVREAADDALVAAVLSGSTIKAAAEAANYSESTARRRFRDEEFLSKFHAARRELFTLGIGRLAALIEKAATAYEDLLEPGTSEPVRRNVARDVFSFAAELGIVPDLEARFAAIERALEISGNGAGA